MPADFTQSVPGRDAGDDGCFAKANSILRRPGSGTPGTTAGPYVRPPTDSVAVWVGIAAWLVAISTWIRPVSAGTASPGMHSRSPAFSSVANARVRTELVPV